MLYYCAVPQIPGVTNQLAVFLANFIFFFGHTARGVLVLRPGLNLHPLHWKCES